MRLSFEHDLPDVNAAFIRKADVTMRVVDRTIHRAAIEIANASKIGAPKSTSQLANSINVTRFGLADYGVSTGTNYARAVEDGTGPQGAPSIKNLVDWIRTSNIVPDDPHMDEVDLAYVIRKHISLYGTKAQPFFEPAYGAVVDKLKKKLSDNVKRALKK